MAFRIIPREGNIQTDVIYIERNGGICVSPDGVGFFWFDSVEEAKEEMGDFPIVRLDGIWSDF